MEVYVRSRVNLADIQPVTAAAHPLACPQFIRIPHARHCPGVGSTAIGTATAARQPFRRRLAAMMPCPGLQHRPIPRLQPQPMLQPPRFLTKNKASQLTGRHQLFRPSLPAAFPGDFDAHHPTPLPMHSAMRYNTLTNRWSNGYGVVSIRFVILLLLKPLMFEQAFRNIDDVLRKEGRLRHRARLYRADFLAAFLKYLDGLEQDKADEAALKARNMPSSSMNPTDGSPGPRPEPPRDHRP